MAGTARTALMVVVLPVVGMAIGAACGDDDDAVETLPPIITTTTTSTTIVTTTTVPQFYEVQSGDTLFAIAERFNVTVDALIALNGILDPDDIEAGQRLEIPAPGAAIPTSSSTSTSSTFVAVTSGSPTTQTSTSTAPAR